VIFVSGSFAPGFSFEIRGSFQRVIRPRKMSAITFPLSFRCFGAPGTLYGTDVPASAHGIWTHPLQDDAWSGVSGASDVPKSTDRLMTDSTPSPDPIGPYVTVTSVFLL